MKPRNIQDLSLNPLGTSFGVDVPNIGYVDNDGWRYSGFSISTGRPLWVADKDVGVMSYTNAIRFAQELKGYQGYNGTNHKYDLLKDKRFSENGNTDDGGIRLPTSAELNQMFHRQTELGNNFTSPNSYYWSSTKTGLLFAFSQNFDGGDEGIHDRYFRGNSVRLVRSEERRVTYPR